MAAAAVLVLALWSMPDPSGGPPATRSKGGATFQAYLRRGDAVHKADDHEAVHPGDQLQFVYSSPVPGFIAVLSRDGAGAAAVYFPDEGRLAWPAPAGEGVALPRSTILDGVLGREVVHALFCASRIELEPLRQALAAGRSPEVPAGCVLESLLLDKRRVE